MSSLLYQAFTSRRKSKGHGKTPSTQLQLSLPTTSTTTSLTETFEELFHIAPAQSIFRTPTLPIATEPCPSQDDIDRAQNTKLPSDVLEIIMDYLLRFPKALKKGSLVCKSWSRAARPRLFAIFIVRKDTDIGQSGAGWRSLSAYPREVLIDGLVRSHNYTSDFRDRMAYDDYAILSHWLTSGIHTLSIKQTNYLLPDYGHSLTREVKNAACSLLGTVQTLRFEIADWMLYPELCQQFSDCVSVRRLVLSSPLALSFNLLEMEKPTLMDRLQPAMHSLEPAPMPFLQHLSLVQLGKRFTYEQGAARLFELLQWLVPRSDQPVLRTFICVLKDTWMTRTWEKFILKGCKALWDIRVSFDFDDRVWYGSSSPYEWFPNPKQWELLELTELEIVANSYSFVCAFRLLQVLVAPQLEVLRIHINIGEEQWNIQLRSHLESLASSLARFGQLRNVIVFSPKANESVRRRFADVERRGRFAVHHDHRQMKMDPFAEIELSAR